MTAKEAAQKVSTNKLTSIAGALSSISAIALALVPSNVLDTCGKAIAESQNPAVILVLFAGGTLLSSIGPSLVSRSAK